MIYSMNARTKKLLEEVLELSPSERALFVVELDASLGDDDSPEQIAKAWDEEIGRRIDGVVSGRVPTRDMREAMAELRARYARR